MSKKPTYEFQNLTKIQQDCLTLIESLGIYELRALARVFGDNSPTVLKRDDHIRIVMEKIISGEDLKPIPLRQGRPYKELSNIEGILAELSQITGKDYTSVTNQQRSVYRGKKVVQFNQVEEEVIKQKLFPIEAKGIFFERTDSEGYMTNDFNGKMTLVKRDQFPQLKTNDFISGTAIVMNSEKEYILDSVKTVNFQSYEKYADNHNPYEQEVPSEKIDFDKYQITLGSRYIVKNNKFSENSEKLTKLLNLLKSKGIITIAIIPNVLYENFVTIQSIGYDNAFTLKYDERPFTINEVLNNFINHIERLQQQGLKLALFIEDITTLANAVDFTFKNNTKAFMGHTETAVELVKHLMLLAKAGGQNKHTTIFTTMDETDMFDHTYISSVYKISKPLEF